MEEEYKKLLENLKGQLEAHPLSDFRRGELKRFILNNAIQIKKVSLIFTQKTLVEKLSSDLGVTLSYRHFIRVLKEAQSSEGIDSPATATAAQSIEVNNKVEAKPKQEDKGRDPIVTEDETDALGRKPYPVDNEITAEKIAEWAHLKLPNFAVRKLISFRISIEEWKALNYTIKSADSINAFVANYCQKKEDDWLESQRNKNT